MYELRDIRGIDGIGLWPLAPGWWLLLAGALALLALAFFLIRWRDWRGVGWRVDARRQLRGIRQRLPLEDGRRLAGELSELMRRIAMARHGRSSCAGLQGDAWLKWLEAHDPLGFPWRERGRLLLTLPYAPPGDRVEGGLLEPLVAAGLAWTQEQELERPRPSLAVRLRSLGTWVAVRG